MPLREVNKPAIVRQVTEDRAERIRRLHGEIEAADRGNLRKAIELGEELLAEKEDCTAAGQHDWRKRLEKLGVPRQTAYDYMDVAKAYRLGGNCPEHGHTLLTQVLICLRETRRAERAEKNPIERDDVALAPEMPISPQPPDFTPQPPAPDPDDLPTEPEGTEDGVDEVEDDPPQVPPYEPVNGPHRPRRIPLPKDPGSGSNGPSPSPRPNGRLGKEGEYVLLSDWQSGSPDWGELRKRAESVASPGRFNPQEGDSIEWALWSWNPVTGCRHDCPYCYARDIAERLYSPRFEPALWLARLSAPRNTTFPEKEAAQWMGHKNVFTCSMADLFGRWVPKEWIDAVLAECKAATQWNFLFLTKFPNRMSEFAFPDNCWVGTTVDCQARVRNAEKSFRQVKAAVKWLSCEPLLEPLKFADLGAFHWVVIGGASRSQRTPAWHPPNRWITNLKAAAWAAGARVYEKTNLYPTDIGESRVREYPGVDREEGKPSDSLIYLPQEIG